MVGNAEPVKEYNYRPLSKLCECQLDVNDQVSTKGWWGGVGVGRQEWRGKRSTGREKKRLQLLQQHHPVTCQRLPCRSPWGPDLSEPTQPQCPRLPPPLAPAPVSGLWHCPTLPAAGQQKQAASTKNSCKTIGCLHKNPAGAQHSGLVLREPCSVAVWLQVLVPSVTLSPSAALPPWPQHLQGPRLPCLLCSAFSVSTKLMP